MGRSPRLFYICYEFPVLTQTFTLGEVRELVRTGVDLTVVGCRAATGAGSPPDVPFLALDRPLSLRTLRAFGRWAVVRPLRLLSLLVRVATARYRDESLKCRLRGFLQLLWGARLASLTAREAGPVHYHAQFVDAASTVAFVAARLTDRPFTVTNHTAYNPYLLRPKLAAAAAIFSISEFDRRHLRDMGGDAGRVEVVYQGIDTDAFPARAFRPAGSPARLLSVAGLREKKGHHVLLAAFADLVRSGVDARLAIVGDGPERGRLARLVDDLDLGERVELAGAEPPERVRERLGEADVFVLACVVAGNGDLDGIPISLMEAMAAGVPVVSTRLSGIPELIEDGREGLLAEPDDAAGLAARVREILDDPERAAAFAVRARAKVERRHDLRESARRLRALIEAVTP